MPGMRLTCVLGLLVAASSASASPPDAATATPRVEAYWYSTLLPDAIATTLFAIALAGVSGDEVAPGAAAFGVAGAFTYAFGAPLVHGSRNNNGHAFASLGLRVALPLAGAWLAGRTEDPDGSGQRVRLSLLAGMVTAAVIDHVFLARQTIAPRQWSPTAVPAHGGVAVGVSATF